MYGQLAQVAVSSLTVQVQHLLQQVKTEQFSSSTQLTQQLLVQ